MAPPNWITWHTEKGEQQQEKVQRLGLAFEIQMKLFPTTRKIPQHCPVGLENDFFHSNQTRKAEKHGDE